MRLQGHLQLQSIIQPFDIAFAIKKFNFRGASFKRILAWKDAFPNRSSQNDIPPFLILIHLPYSKYKGVKIYFYLCHYQNQKFSLVCRTRIVQVALLSHLRCSFSTRVTLVSHSCYKCLTCVASVAFVLLTFVLLPSHSCHSCLAFVL